MRRDKSISVRFAAVGGQAVKAEMREIGSAGKSAMQGVVAGAVPASDSLDNFGAAAAQARGWLEEIAVKSAATARALRTTADATSDAQRRINEATGVVPSGGMSAAEMLRQGQALDDLRARYNPLFAVIRQYRNELSGIRAAHLEGAISFDEMAAASSRLRRASLDQIAVLKGQATHIDLMTRSAGRAGHRMQQMFFQVNDIGVSLAGGQNPFVVLVQQGTQIAQIYGFGNGGVGAAFRDVGGMIAKMPGWLKAVGIAAAAGMLAVKGLQSEINQSADVTVSMGDTALAVFQVLRDRIWTLIRPTVQKIGEWFDAAWDWVVAGVKLAGNAIIKGMQIAVAGIRTAIDVVPAIFSIAFNRAKAEVLFALSDIADAVGRLVQGAANALNGAFGTNFAPGAAVAEVAADLAVGGADADQAAREGVKRRDAGYGAFAKRRAEIAASDPMGDLFNEISGRAQDNARKRLAGKDDGKGSGGKAGGAAAEQKRAVEELIKSLQQELLVLRETDPVKKRMLEYAEQLAEATDAERAQVQGLVETLDRAEHGWEAVGRSMKEYAEESKRLGSDMGQVFVDAFGAGEDAFAKMVAGGKFEWRNLINSMIEDFARLTARQYITGPLAGLMGGWFGSFGGGGDLLTSALKGAGLSVPSFDGGGHTGNGSRTGGLDGRGGFLAMVHPRERIMDETKGQGGGVVRVVATHDPGILMQIIDERAGGAVQAGLESYDRNVLPHSVRAQLRDPRRVG